MGVTQFSSVVSATTVGTADINALSQSFDRLSGSIDSATQKGNQLAEHKGFSDFAAKVKEGIQDPLGAAGEAVEGLLQRMGPLGTAAAAGFGIFTAGAAAMAGWAKELGDYATQIENVSIRTGLSTKEVGQFSFAAKLAGSDVSVFERSMRMLSQGLGDNTEQGKRARQGLADLGVSAYDAMGQVRPMADIFMQISEGLGGISDPARRDAESLAIFGRAGIELLPTMLKLSQAVQTAKDMGFGPSDADIAQWEKYHAAIAVAETKWDEFGRKMKDVLLALPAYVIEKGSEFNVSHDRSYVLGMARGRSVDSGEIETDFIGDQLKRLIARNLTAAQTAGLAPLIASSDARNAAAITPLDSSGLLEQARKKLTDLEGGLRSGVVPGAQWLDEKSGKMTSNEDIIKQINAQKALVEGMEIETKNRNLSIELQNRWNDRLREDLDQLDKQRQALTGKEFEGATKLLWASTGGLPTFAANDIESAFDPQLARNTALQMMQYGQRTRNPWAQDADIGTWWQGMLQDRADQVNLRGDRDTARRSLGLYGAQASLAGTSQGTQIATEYAMRKQFADQEYQDLLTIAAAKKEGADKDEAFARAEEDRHQKLFDADMQRDEALLELANRQKEGFQSFATGAFSSLVSGARGREGAGPALEKFLENQFLGMADKVVGTGAGMLWSGGLSKLIPHVGDADSTLGKLFQGTPFGPDPLKLATMDNTTATVANTTALQNLATAGLGSGTGGGGYSPMWGGSSTVSSAGLFSSGSSSGTSDLGGESGFDSTITGEGNAVAKFGIGNVIGIGAALAAGGMGIYSGIKAGGTQGDLEAAGSAAGMLGAVASQLGKLSSTLSSTLGPIGMGVGLALGLASMFMGNPKQERQTAETDTAMAARFTAPTPTHYMSDVYGQQVSMNMQGNFQPIVQVTQNFSAIDAASLIDRASDFANVAATALEGNMSPRLSTAIRNTVSPQ
jgi:hypothetical protein